MGSGAAQQLFPAAHMASIGGTITHSPNTSGSDICWVLFHSSDINPIHQLFCQLPLSGLRGDCSFGGSEYWFILAPHCLFTKFDWIFLLTLFVLPYSFHHNLLSAFNSFSPLITCGDTRSATCPGIFYTALYFSTLVQHKGFQVRQLNKWKI